MVLAKNYVDNLSEEARKGMTEKVLKGGWPTLAPFGYKNAKGPVSVVPDPEQAKVVRWLFHRFAGGDISVRELNREYRRAGFKQHVVRAMIYKILRDPFYKGVMRWKGDLYPGTHEPLVDDKTWDHVQVLLDATTKPASRVAADLLTYRGLITCAHCGCAIVGELKKGKYIYYHCTENKGRCKENGWVRQEDLDRQFAESLSTLRLHPALHKGVKKAIRDAHLARARESREEVESLTEKARSLQDQMAMTYRDRLDGDIPGDMWRTEHGRLAEELKSVHNEIRAHREADLSFYAVAEQVLDFTASAEKMFLEGDTAMRRQVVKLVYSNSVLRSGTLMNTVKSPFNLLAEGVKCDSGGGDWTRTSDTAGMSRVLLPPELHRHGG